MKILIKFLRYVTLTATGVAITLITTVTIAGELVSVLSPQELQSMGIDPDTPNGYKSLGNTANKEEANFGSGVNYTSIDAKAFNGREGDWNWGNSGNGITRLSAGEQFADAQLHVPHGAKLTEIRWWGSDTSVATDMNLFFWPFCLPDAGPGSFVFTLIVSESSNTSAGNFSQSFPLSHTVDNQSCVYRVRAKFGETGTLQRLYKITFKWIRQISPGPATASFSDVPTSHSFYSAIEAMGASGITGGCSATMYCPDANLTRGQMAAFLARALGISWQTIPDQANP